MTDNPLPIAKALRDADFDTNKLFDLCVEAAELIEQQNDALRVAKDVIEVWHGPNAWHIYERSSPEMKTINAVLAKAEGRAQPLPSKGDGE